MSDNRINISSKISEATKQDLKTYIGHPINKIMIGGDFGVYGSLNKSLYTGNQNTICFDIEGELHTISIFSDQIFPDQFNPYDKVFIKSHHFGKIDTNYFGPEKNMLLRNRGIFYLQDFNNLRVQSIDVFGVNVKDYLDLDEDFPEEAKIVSVDIDLLFRFNTNQQTFFTSFCKEGKTLLNFYHDEKEFRDFIEITKHWGELNELQKKYIIT